MDRARDRAHVGVDPREVDEVGPRIDDALYEVGRGRTADGFAPADRETD